jgi:hypothetical protein
MLHKIIIFSIRLVILASIVFYVHIELLKYYDLPPFDNMIIEGYYANIILAIFIYSSLTFLQKKYNDQLGFLFMAGSFLKFGVFFVFFSSEFKADNEITRLEFLSFFVPYIVCLLVETLGIIKVLNPSKNEE